LEGSPTTKLDLVKYTEARAAHELLQAEYNRVKNEIMAKVQEELDAASAEFAPRLALASEEVAALENEIKSEVKAQGKSVKGSRWQFVFAKGRVSWNTNALDAYAADHPEVAQFKTVGKPIVSVRAVK